MRWTALSVISLIFSAPASASIFDSSIRPTFETSFVNAPFSIAYTTLDGDFDPLPFVTNGFVSLPSIDNSRGTVAYIFSSVAFTNNVVLSGHVKQDTLSYFGGHVEGDLVGSFSFANIAKSLNGPSGDLSPGVSGWEAETYAEVDIRSTSFNLMASDSDTTPLRTWSVGTQGFAPVLGGSDVSVPVYAESFTDGSINGSGTISGNLMLQIYTDVKTAGQYAADILRSAHDIVDRPGQQTSEPELAREFYRQAIYTREHAYEGSEVNQNIKDVEYYGRGLEGGILVRTPGDNEDHTDGLNEFFNEIAPISAPVYNALKSIGFSFKSGSGSISGVSGSDQAIDGWINGFKGMTVDDAVNGFISNTGGGTLDLAPTSKDSSPDRPLIPDVRLDMAAIGIQGQMNLFALNTMSDRVYYLDPAATNSMVIATYGLLVDGLFLPTWAGSLGDVTMTADGRTVILTLGSLFNFSSNGFDAANQIVLRGLDWGGKNPFVGLQFSDPGSGVVGVAALNAPSMTSAVPEASTWLMMMLGLSLIGVATRRRPRTMVTHLC